MHYYCGYTAIPPVYDFTLWLAFKLWAVLAALSCLRSWDTRLLNCAQRSRPAWCRAKRGARDSAMCEREHSTVQPNVHPWSTTRDGPGQEPERQQGTQRDNWRGRRWRTNPHPLRSSLTPNPVHLRARIQQLSVWGRGALKVLCPDTMHTFTVQTWVEQVKFPSWLVFLLFYILIYIVPINYYWMQCAISV